MKEHFKKTAASRVLPGWVWLGVTKDGQLVITQSNNEDNTLMNGKIGFRSTVLAMTLSGQIQCTPILALDLWEHAYFTQYEGNKEAYVDKFWSYVNWAKVSENFEKFNLTGKLAPLI